MYPALPKIELFARGAARPGWAVWGNEALPQAAE
jgi:N6-adenosine-specific RNA methylase IME4